MCGVGGTCERGQRRSMLPVHKCNNSKLLWWKVPFRVHVMVVEDIGEVIDDVNPENSPGCAKVIPG